MGTSATDWTVLRTFSSQAAEGDTAAPAIGSMVNMAGGPTRWVEVRARADGETGAITHTSNPTVAVVTIWGQYGGAADEAKIDPLGDFSVPLDGAGVGKPAVPVQFEVFGRTQLYATIKSFTGGTSPQVSGVIEARLVEHS